MDAFIASEARQILEALTLSRSPASAGILVGHTRGRRFLVERAVPLGSGLFPSLRTYIRLSSLLEDRIIGFFSLTPETGWRRESPPPFTVGKIILSVKARRKAGLSFRGFSFDYTDKYVLKPVRVMSRKGIKL